MIKSIRNIDKFNKNVVFVFFGTSLANLFNLLYQLLIAHRLTPSDFAAFNSLLSILMLFTVPLGTLQIAVTKYSAEFKAQGKIEKLQILFSGLFRKAALLAISSLIIFYFLSFYIIEKLKIYSIPSGYILAILLGLSCITPIFSGGLQGLELFNWLIPAALISGVLKLILAFIFIGLGFNIAGALGAYLAASLIGIFISFFPLKKFLSFKIKKDGLAFKEIFLYLFPVMISYFCFLSLVSFDMVLVKYFFTAEDSGVYALAQIVGKIFLFLPGAISMVMFPRTSGLKAMNLETVSTLKRSLFYAFLLCLIASLIYNTFPSFVLKILTGKTFKETIFLGRLFSFSMTFYALSFVLIAYFLSLKDLRFIKYLILFAGLQFFCINFYHKSLIQVQTILCINAILLFFIHWTLAFKKTFPTML